MNGTQVNDSVVSQSDNHVAARNSGSIASGISQASQSFLRMNHVNGQGARETLLDKIERTRVGKLIWSLRVMVGYIGKLNTLGAVLYRNGNFNPRADLSMFTDLDESMREQAIEYFKTRYVLDNQMPGFKSNVIGVSVGITTGIALTVILSQIIPFKGVFGFLELLAGTVAVGLTSVAVRRLANSIGRIVDRFKWGIDVWSVARESEMSKDLEAKISRLSSEQSSIAQELREEMQDIISSKPLRFGIDIDDCLYGLVDLSVANTKNTSQDSLVANGQSNQGLQPLPVPEPEPEPLSQIQQVEEQVQDQ